MQTVLITGCSSGIGEMAAKLFASRGWNVAATARNPGTIAALAGSNVAVFRLDVTDEASIADAVAATIARFGRIDVLVNHAGYGVFGPLEGISREELSREFEVNVVGLAAVTRHVLPVMRQQHSGTIVNMSSIGGRVTSPLASAYYSSKFAVEGLSESLAYELKAHGIRVKLVEPGHFKTRFIERSLQWSSHDAYEPQLGNMRAWVEHSDRRAPSAEPVADAIFRAATDTSARLRYPVQGRLLLTLHALMPNGMWRAMMGAALSRRPRTA